MRYIYENVPHHQDQLKSLESLRDGSPWSSILALPDYSQRTSQAKLPTIVEHSPEGLEPSEEARKEKGKRRITDKFTSPPSSPRVLNIGYGTPFKSSSQFFVRPGGIQLPPAETQAQQNVLVGLGLPRTPAFDSIPSSNESRQLPKTNPQPQSRPSNPFKGRQLPSHMRQDHRNDIDYMLTPANRQDNTTRDRYSHQPPPAETRSDGGSSQHRQPSDNGYRGSNSRHCDNPGGDPGDDDDNSEGDTNPHRGNGPSNRDTGNNDPPSNLPRGGGGGGGSGGGGGNGPSGGNYQANNSNSPQGNIPYGNLVATIRNELKQDQLPVWDGNKDTAIEYFWKVQQLAALEGDIPVALGYWLWKSLKENSRIWMWFTTLPFSEQTKMRTHYLHYLKGIKDNYLG